MQFCRILANRAIIGHILDRKRNERFFRVFRYRPGHRRGKRSPYRAYFQSSERILFREQVMM